MTLEGPTKLVGDNNLTIRTRDNTRLPLNTDYIDMQPEPGASTEGFINSVGHAFTPRTTRIDLASKQETTLRR